MKKTRKTRIKRVHISETEMTSFRLEDMRVDPKWLDLYQAQIHQRKI